jgi:hypothetical protein
VLLLSAANREKSAHLGRPIAPGVRLVAGPEPSGDVDPIVFSPTPIELGGLSVAVLLLLVVAGYGWARSLVPGPLVDRLALAPAFGLGVLVLVGMVLDALGLHPGGHAGVLAPVLSTCLGWLPMGGFRPGSVRSSS